MSPNNSDHTDNMKIMTRTDIQQSWWSISISISIDFSSVRKQVSLLGEN